MKEYFCLEEMNMGIRLEWIDWLRKRIIEIQRWKRSYIQIQMTSMECLSSVKYVNILKINIYLPHYMKTLLFIFVFQIRKQIHRG